MGDDPTCTLHTRFGYESFRTGQEEAITSLLRGQHTLVVMPTGAGKSLIYQLCALHRPGVTLVISPLIALMKDQVDSLARRSIPAAFINSSVSGDEQAERLQQMASGALRLVYVAPERLRNMTFRRALSRVSLGLLAVDEAHCISQWGHDFRPDYLHIAAARTELGDPLTAALTATATPQVQDDIVTQLGLSHVQRVVTGFNRPNLSFEVRSCSDNKAKLHAMTDLLADLNGGAAIVYAGARHTTEDVADFVQSLGHEARFYHAGMDNGARALVQESFISGDLPIVVATNAFGMGIDRPDVRMVIHYDVPGTLEAYYQEAGRAGRDGDAARAVLLYSPRDRALQESFIQNDAATAADIRRLYDAVRSIEGQWMGRDELSMLTGLSETRIRVGLAQLEAAGAVEHLGDDGLRMLLRRGPWNDSAAQATAEQNSRRGQYRRRQLATMIAYAETNACRRRVILEHFGDHGPADADVCCDNCTARTRTAATPSSTTDSLSQAERAALIILDAVRRLKWEVGRSKLAQMLAGSRAKQMHSTGYDKETYYGRLSVFKVSEIERMIDQMLSLGHLKQVGGKLPVLRLTPQGQAALKNRTAIPLQIPSVAASRARPVAGAGKERGATIALTQQMLLEGLKPAQIAARRGLSEDTIFNHLAQSIATGSVRLEHVIDGAVTERVRATIAQVGSAERLAPLKMSLPSDISYGQIRCVVEAWKRERQPVGRETNSSARTSPAPGVAPDAASGADAVATFLEQPHPRPLVGPWRGGWALGFHSIFGGADWQRSTVGALAYRVKYQGDPSAVTPLVTQAAALCRQDAALAEVDLVVPVPPTHVRALDPVGVFAEALAAALGKPCVRALRKARQTAPQKDLQTLAQKRANVAGAFAVSADLHGARVLVVDDLFDSGATLSEVTRVLTRAGAASVCVLTMTRTIHSDH